MSGGEVMIHATVEHSDSGWGGIATAVKLAATGTAAMGMETLVLCPGVQDSTSELPAGYRKRTVNVEGCDSSEIYLAADRVLAGRRLSAAMFEAIEAEYGHSHVHLLVHSEELASLLEMARCTSWCRRRTAFSHGLASQEHPSRPALAAQQQELFRHANCVYVASESQRELATTLFPGIRFHHLPLPLTLLNDEAADFLCELADRRPGHLVAAGRAVGQKGFDILLHALAALPAQSEMSMRMFLGHGDPRIEEECKALADKLGRDVVVSGWSSRSELLREMAKATAVVVPSRFEPLGMVAAEALALGTPVIATKVGGLSELVGAVPGSILLDAEDFRGPRPSDLASVLSRVFSAAPWEVDGRSRLSAYSLTRFSEALALGIKEAR